MSSLDTTMEEGDSFVSNTDAIIYPTSDYSGWGGDSLISDPNIVSSSTSTNDNHHQQISTAGGGGGVDDLMIESSPSVASSRFMNTNEKQSEIRLFNVDFRSLSYFTTLLTQLPQKHFQRDYQLEPQEGTPFRMFGSNLAPNFPVAAARNPSYFSELNFHLPTSPPKPKTYECFICGLEFPIGQALGGHMRRHRAVRNAHNLQAVSPVVKKSNSRRVLCLDLNLTPLENDLESKLGEAASIV